MTSAPPDAPEATRVLIAGGGIAGLAAAIGLARAGHAVVVLERAAAFEEVGAGIQLSPNACQALAALGALERVMPKAVTPVALSVRSLGTGPELLSVPIAGAIDRKYGAPYALIHRADLLAALVATAAELPAISVRLGATLATVSTTAAGVAVQLTSGETLMGAALIGADGVRSAVRTKALGGPVAFHTGRIAYRATLPADETPESVRAITGLWMAEKAHVVHYPIAGGALINVVAVVQDGWSGEGWSEPATREDVLARFANWPEPARSLLSAPPSWVKWALSGFDPNFTWSQGPITLMGDAAHAMLPFLAQGGAMALEDAAVLARQAAKSPGDWPATFRAYEAERKPRAARVVREARENGILYHLGGAAAFARDMGLRLLGPKRLADRYDWLWKWKP